MAPNSKLNAKRKAARESAKPKEPRRINKQKDENTVTSAPIPLELQQLLLNIFRNSFTERFETDIAPLVQEVKGHLYDRDFATAFGKESYLEVYAARWSPSRALGYAEVIWDLREHLFPTEDESPPRLGEDIRPKRWKVMCLGGGAGAEIVALAGVQKMFQLENPNTDEVHSTRMEIDAIDVANWTSVVQKLDQQSKTAPPLSKYASAATKAANAPLLGQDNIEVAFHQHDVLSKDFVQLNPHLEAANVVTLLFTLNELYSTSLPGTQRFLWRLTEYMRVGSLLLVIDSPGSYSSVTLNGAEKKYPMQWLLDHTLLKQPTGKQREKGKEEEIKWEKVQEDDSKWFRLDERLEYPIELENMRMQLHLYRRVEGNGES